MGGADVKGGMQIKRAEMNWRNKKLRGNGATRSLRDGKCRSKELRVNGGTLNMW